MNVIFFASGFAGLIYESIWTHYLKLFLGHAAYAQTLVLGIFMGGMAIGAAIAANRSARIANPLKTYAGIEIAIGLLAIAFHPIFTAATGGFYDFAFERHLSGMPFVAAKWGLAALLILPQSILLGATFPVFAAAVTRASSTGTGRSIATLYFANSMGGAIGVLASGFFLIPSLGLPGTISAAGIVNLAIGAVVLKLAQGVVRSSEAAPRAASSPFGSVSRLLVAVSFFTGASSFIYEVGWIRMLSLVLGSATHSFELMLCAFIVGLALGGLWVRKRIDSAANPGVLLGYVQIAMGIAAIATIPLHSASFDIIGWVVTNVPKTGEGYTLLNLVRYGISSLIMFPAAFCAGMTLPLATRILHSNEHQGEKAIGVIYSANTIGAITGLAFAVHVGFPVFGLTYLVASGAIVDVLLGIALLLAFAGRSRLKQCVVALTACVAGTAAAATTFNPQKIASGVFRTGQASLQAEVIDIAHGRTATITVEKRANIITIRTNGKPDASAMLDAPHDYVLDEVTMNLIGAAPLMLHPAPKRVANIGFGSGITGEAILADPRVQRLDTIEIEPRMVELARHFGKQNQRVYDDPRSAIHIDDAKSFFASNGKTYDVIVSEPSNPWVSGVAGLFSVEFYRHVSRYLARDGLFAQWIHIYETDADRVTSVIKAMDEVFDDYLVMALNSGDVLLIASPHGKLAVPEKFFSNLSPDTTGRLKRLQIANDSDMAIRIIGNKAMFKPWLDARPVPANSDFAPYLDVHADVDRFMRKNWYELYNLALSPYMVSEVLGARPALAADAALTINRHFGNERPGLVARLFKTSLLGTDSHSASIPPDTAAQFANQAAQLLTDCRNPPLGDNPYVLTGVAVNVLPYLSKAEGRAVLDAMEQLPCLGALPESQVLWRDLLRHVADRNAEGFGETADMLLELGHGATEARRKYLVGMAILGHVGAGNHARAKAIWTTHAQSLQDSKTSGLALAILRDHALASQSDASGAIRNRSTP